MKAALLSVLLATAALSVAPASADTGPLVVAVLDTGIDASHPEFAPGQVVAWWDFTGDKGQGVRLPGAGEVMDPRFPPYDWNGHGTQTASLVGGANTPDGMYACGKTSYAPGVGLAVAKVATLDGRPVALAPAIRWAVDVVGADVVSISISSYVPSAPFMGSVGEAIAEARAKGVLVVVAAGNGALNAGLAPYPSEAALYSYSPHALVVGAADRDGPDALATHGNLDPEVVAWSEDACVAFAGTNTYVEKDGTSFSAPLVAGAAASAMADARAANAPADAATIEDVLKHAARDSLLPYAKEGWGFLGDDEVASARAAAAAGTLPAHPCAVEPCTDPAYEAYVADTARFAADNADGDLGAAGAHFFLAHASNGAGVLGTSTPLAGEAEVYAVPLAKGARGEVTFSYADEVVSVSVDAPTLAFGEDADLRIYRPGALDDGILEADELVRVIGRGAGFDETATWTAAQDGTYLAVVYGWSVARDVRIDVTGATFLEEGVLLGQSVMA